MENTYTSKMDKEENSSINEDKAAANPLPTLSSTVDISQLNEIFVNKCETDKLVPNDNVNTSDNNGHAIATTVYVPETRTPELPTVDSPPASKKPKLSLAKLKNKITIEAIISDTFITDIPLRNVISCVIGDRKQAAKLVNSLPPLPQNLLHLKRIRTRGGRLEIIVCPPPDTTEQEINDPISAVREMLQLQNPDSWRGLDLSLLHLSPVASSLPLCRKQYDAVFTYWPCNFHPDRPIEEIMSENAGFSGVEIEEIYNIVTTQVMEHSRRHENRQVCLVYDPSGDKEILVCTLGQGGPNPLNHAVMVAVEQVGIIHGAPSTNSNSSYILTSSSKARNGPTDYLCTGLDIYLSHEPCVMCAMALLHSRAKRVFFVKPESSGGSLSVTKLHCLPGINHRYQVFQVSLK